MKNLLAQDRVRIWLTFVGVSIILIGTAYAMVQQSTRLAANDLPMAAAQTAKHELESGSQPNDVIPAVKTNLRSDSTVFLTITDNAEHVLASSATLDGQPSLPPAGTFAFTKDHGSDHFTWQPKDGVRLATYMMRYGTSPNDGFIVAGRSLKQAEDRIETYTWLAMAGTVAVIAFASLTLLIPTANKTSRKK